MHSLPKVDRERKKILKKLQSKVGLRFKKIAYLEWALQHRSYVNEVSGKKLANNERLEFLGDSILGYVMADYLFQRFPKDAEGRLSMLKASLVNREALAAMAKELSLGEYLLLGKGEEKGGGRKRDSILADVFEALIAAYYLDRGFKAVKRFLIKSFKHRLKNLETDKFLDNAKNRLQKLTQGKLGVLPEYVLVNEKGPQHKKTFEVEVKVNGKLIGVGQAKTKKKAEEAAAQKALHFFR